jgi:hypothetical protein
MIMVKVSCFPWIWVRVCYSRGCAGLQNPNRTRIDQILKYYKPCSRRHRWRTSPPISTLPLPLPPSPLSPHTPASLFPRLRPPSPASCVIPPHPHPLVSSVIPPFPAPSLPFTSRTEPPLLASSSLSFAKLQRFKTTMAGRTLFVRFSTKTNDAWV